MIILKTNPQMSSENAQHGYIPSKILIDAFGQMVQEAKNAHAIDAAKLKACQSSALMTEAQISALRDNVARLDADACIKQTLYADWLSNARILAWPVVYRYPSIHLPDFRPTVPTSVANVDAGDGTSGSSPCLY